MFALQVFLKPSEFGVSYNWTLATACELLDSGVHNPWGSAQTIRVWLAHWTLESLRTLECDI